MKLKIITFLENNKGAISLFSITLITELIAMLIASAFGAELTTKVVLTASTGILSSMSIDVIGDIVGMSLSNTKRSAILAIIIGAILALI